MSNYFETLAAAQETVRGRRLALVRSATRAEKTYCVICVINFVLFAALGFWLGDAESGKVVGDRYFLNNHGLLTEVSRGVFLYSLWHGRAAMLGLISVGFVAWRVERRVHRG